MSFADLETIAFDAEHLPEQAQWASRITVRLPAQLIRNLAGGLPALSNPDVESLARSAAADLRLRAAFTNRPPASARLPVNYHVLPSAARRMMGRAIGYVQRARQASWSRFPGWPIDLSADLAADLAGERGIVFRRTPVLLSHDIDSPEGLKNLMEMFLPIEEAVGARSANYIVPCAWPVDHAILAEVRDRGHEIGVHGYNHANQTPFADDDERRRRLAGGRAFGDRYSAIGYRSPSLLRTPALLADLAQLYRYDSSIPTSGGAFPVPNNGCASARPWRLGNLWEIPVTLPRDGSLRFLGYAPEQIGNLWCETADTIARSGGIISLLTHCEARFSGNKAMLATYRSFVEWISRDSRFEFMRMADLVDQIEASGAEGK